MKLEVLIMGQSYLLSCPPESQALLQAAAARVDAVMCRIRDNGKGRIRDRIAVLAALNLAFEQAQQPELFVNPPESASDFAPVFARGNASTSTSAHALLSSLIDRIDTVLEQTQPAMVAVSFSPPSIQPDIQLP